MVVVDSNEPTGGHSTTPKNPRTVKAGYVAVSVLVPLVEVAPPLLLLSLLLLLLLSCFEAFFHVVMGG